MPGRSGALPKKGAKSFLAERLFVEPARIYLHRDQADNIHTKRGVVTGPGGKRSIVTQSEYIDGAVIDFDVKFTRDPIAKLSSDRPETIADRIPEIWVRFQDNGLGAMRSSGYGTFDIVAWDKVNTKKTAPKHTENGAQVTA